MQSNADVRTPTLSSKFLLKPDDQSQFRQSSSFGNSRNMMMLLSPMRNGGSSATSVSNSKWILFFIFRHFGLVAMCFSPACGYRYRCSSMILWVRVARSAGLGFEFRFVFFLFW